MSCGTALTRACPSCGTEAPPEARFCMSCGTALDGAAAPGPAAPAAAAPRPAPAADERRQVTILFADLSGYTAVAERLDPEVVKSLVDRTLLRLKEEVDAHGGTVDKFIGDNVMALFGAPVAHEDDAERAVRAGLGMQAAMEGVNEELERSHGVRFALRVGVNTGEVVYGALGDSYTVTGDAVNVASRLQAAGRPGAVTVGTRTMRASRHAVAFDELTPLELKGKAEPVPAWEATAVLERHAVRRPGTESPLVGRRTELSLILDAQRRSEREGRAHLLTVVGPAGVGKSRLLREARRGLGELDRPPALREGRCPAYGSGVVFWPVGEVLRAEAALADEDSADEASRKLCAHLDALLLAGGESDAEARSRSIGLIAYVLGYDTPLAEPLDSEDPRRVRDGFFGAVRALVEAMAEREPLVLAFEDIHWADDGMLDLIGHLARFVRGPLLILCLAREDLLERRERWGSGRRTESVHFLDPLDADEAAQLVAALLPADQAALAAQVAERTGGNPLFAEEMARTVSEEGASLDRLPDTVQAVLAARLDALEPAERRILQHAAVVGRTFGREALESVALAEGVDLESVIDRLQEKDILVPERAAGSGDAHELGFRHVLIRDVAYETLPKAVRANKHFEVGTLLEQRAGDRSDEVVASLAEHFGRAATLGRETGLDATWQRDVDARALRFREAAADAAAGVGSNREALGHLEAARTLAPDGAVRARIGEKLGDVQQRMGRIPAAIEVWRDALDRQRVEEDLERAADLLRKMGAALAQQGERQLAIEHLQKGINLLKDGPPSRELARLYEEAATVYMEAGDNMLAIYAAEKALRLAERLESPRAAGRAHGIFGQVFARMGDIAKARENLERSVDLARGSDPAETVQALVALARQREGSEADLAGADAAYAEALGLAEALGDVPAQVEVHAGLAQLAVLRADWDAVSRAETVIEELGERGELGGRTALPLALQAVLAWREGDPERAAGIYRKAHELAEQAGWSEIAATALNGLAISLRDAGDMVGAIGAYDRALDVCERAGMVGRALQLTAGRAVLLELAGRHDAARESALEAAELAGRLSDPAGHAAAAEADGTTAEGAEGPERLAEAAAAWDALGRPLDAARCEALAARALVVTRPKAAAAAAEKAAATFERLGVPHLAAHAREFVSV
jgi:class 3 adenylate cyclase/tetratricopeptide (TPR) repeat protein